MLLNAASSPPLATAPGADGTPDVARAAPAPAPTASGRALLCVLERQAQAELLAMAAAQASVPMRQVNREQMWLAWDLGLTGDRVDLP